MPNGKRIFSSTNVIGTRTKWKKSGKVGSTYAGLCKALAVLWCENIIYGKKPYASKPSDMRAGALQFHFEKQWDSDLVFGMASLECEETDEKQPNKVTEYIKDNPGTYQIRVPGHAIAVHIDGDDYFFYDSESGLWEYSDWIKWAVDIEVEYDNDKPWKYWKLKAA